MADRLDAATLRRAMELFAGSLRDHQAELDSLNVYPVPDGDTGTNLLMTQEAVLSSLPATGEGGDDLRALGAAISRGSLMGARGNSGVILSQILRGLWERPPAGNAFGPDEFAGALRRAADEARRAVARPAEGTILTVIRDASIAAEAVAGDGEVGCSVVARAALRSARRSLLRTKELLPELREAGVVDAGAKGVVLLLDALHAALAGEAPNEQVGPLGPVGHTTGTGTEANLEFPFEVQYLLEAPDASLPGVRQELAGLGDSLVVVGGHGLFNVHVHTDQPERAVEVGERAGMPKDVRIADLREQVMDCIGGQARAVRIAEQVTGLLAVVEGDGLTRALASLGALVVEGGPGNVPSSNALAEGIEAVSGTTVIVLSNDPAIANAAKRAVRHATREVLALPVAGIPPGLAAATAFNAIASPEENVAAMTTAAGECTWAELMLVFRDPATPSGSVNEGSWTGSRDGQVVCVGASPADCATQVVRAFEEVEGQAEVVTLIEGADATAEDRRTVRAALKENLPDLHLEVLEGGQPGSPFLLWIE
jgi:DAK2 domain fusion protein YloV